MNRSAFTAFFLLSFARLSFAAVPDEIRVPIDLKGRWHQVAVQPADVRKIVFYATTSGNTSSAFSGVFEGPAGMKVTASMSMLSTSPLAALNRNRNFWPVSLLSRRKVIAEETSSCISYKPNTEPEEKPSISKHPSDSPLCDLFSEEELGDIAKDLARVYGGAWSSREVCGYIVDNYFGGAAECDPTNPACPPSVEGTPTPAKAVLHAGSAGTKRTELYGFLQKDACLPTKQKYVVRFAIDLSDVDDSTETLVAVQVTEYRYTGSKAAELKPVSDGMFAPQPIILMAFLGTFCGQKLNAVRWARGRPLTTSVRVTDLIMYKQQMFIRTPIGKVLTGGRGTFELFTSIRAYGVCLELVRRKQKVNGF